MGHLLALFYGALAAPPGLFASTAPSTAFPSPETEALVQRLVLERAAAVASVQRLADEREEQLFAELGAKDRRLRAEQASLKAAQADLSRVVAALAEVTAERQSLVEAIAARDVQFDAEISEYRQQVAAIAGSPDPRKRVALGRYAEGDRAGGFEALVAIQEAESKAVAAGWREIGALALDRRDRGEMETAQVIPIFERAQQMDPADAWGWIELRRLYQVAGRLAEARRAAEQAVSHAITGADRGTAEVDLGDVLLESGDLAGARSRYEVALGLAERRLGANPESLPARLLRTVSLDRLGGVLQASGDLAAARRRFEEALKVRQELSASDAGSDAKRHAVAISLSKLGQVAVLAGDPAGARERFEASLKIEKGRAEAHPDSGEVRRNLAVVLDQLGDLASDAGDWGGAYDRYGEALRLRERLALADPSNGEAQREYGLSLGRIADLLLEGGAPDQAKRVSEASLKTHERLAAANPESAQAHRDHAVALGRLAEAQLDLGDLAGSRRSREASLEILARLAGASPKDAAAQRDLASTLGALARVLQKAGDAEGARARAEESLRLREALAALDPGSARAHRDLLSSHVQMAELPGGEWRWKEALRIALVLKEKGSLAPDEEEAMLGLLRRKVAEAEEKKNRP